MKNTISFTAQQLTLAAFCTAVLCITAPVSVPIGPISLTLGVFGVFFAGAFLPPAAATCAAAAYLLLGFCGIPVFAGFSAGPQALFGMTGGYLAAYPLMAGTVAWFCKKGQTGWMPLAGIAAAQLICYLLGTVWFVFVSGSTVPYAVAVCVLPFVLLDFGKGIAALFLAQRIKKHTKLF